MHWASKSPDLNLIKYVFQLLKAKTPQEQAGTALKAWQSITWDEKRDGLCLWIPDFRRSLTKKDLQASIKNDNLAVSFSNYFSSLKKGAHI